MARSPWMPMTRTAAVSRVADLERELARVTAERDALAFQLRAARLADEPGGWAYQLRWERNRYRDQLMAARLGLTARERALARLAEQIRCAAFAVLPVTQDGQQAALTRLLAAGQIVGLAAAHTRLRALQERPDAATDTGVVASSSPLG